MASPFIRPGLLSRAFAWLRGHPYTLVAGLLFLGYAVPFQLRGRAEWDDVYVRAGARLLAGEHLYVWTADYVGYVYPPFAALVAVPFALLPPGVARAAWYLLNVVCLVQVLRWAWWLSGGGPLQGPRAGGAREHLICFLGLACALSYAVNCLAHQQSDLVIAALVLGGCVALARSRGWLAATAFGLAAALKCTPLLWGPYLLWRGRWKEAGWLVCVAVGVNLLPNLLSAPEPGRLYLTDWAARYLLPMKQANYYPGTWASAPIYNQSLAGTVNRWALTECRWTERDCPIVDRPHPLPARTVKLLVYGAELLLVAGMLVVLGRRPLPALAALAPSPPVAAGAEYSVVLLLMLFLSPMSNTQHFVTIVLPAFCLGRLAVQQRRWAPGLLLLASLVARATVVKWLWGEQLSTLCLWLGSVTWSAAFLLAGCAYVLLRSRSAAADSIPTTLPLPAQRALSA
jgi:hypothetical protein